MNQKEIQSIIDGNRSRNTYDTKLEIAFQLCRIADALEKITALGIDLSRGHQVPKGPPPIPEGL